ncbi:MAG: hypothetical protein ICV87_04700, partial [Gemmatimonadetes bacterium]|nr:hypothetical protein [Gemmatimonadota bacterium]
MHSDRINRGAAALALAALLGTAHALPAQDTLEAGTRLEAAAHEPRRSGDRIMVGRDLENFGTVNGDARVLGGRLVNHHGRVLGEMRVEGGEERVAGRRTAGDGR